MTDLQITIKWCGNRYIITPLNSDNRFYVFGIEQGGKTKEEALFWAERLASKNGFDLVLPKTFKDVIPSLP